MTTLTDPQSGCEVRLCIAQLPQSCRRCGAQLEGHWAAALEGGAWACLEHLERELMTASLTPAYRARLEARIQTSNVKPGDQIIATRELLAALRETSMV